MCCWCPQALPIIQSVFFNRYFAAEPQFWLMYFLWHIWEFFLDLTIFYIKRSAETEVKLFFLYLITCRILIFLDVKVVSSEFSALLLLSPLLQPIGLKSLSAWDGSLSWPPDVSSNTWFRTREQGHYLGLYPHHPSRLKLDGLTLGPSVQNIQLQQKQVFSCK